LIYSKALGSSLQGEKSTTNRFPALMGITRFGMELLQSKTSFRSVEYTEKN
jgi:hypothetical protein